MAVDVRDVVQGLQLLGGVLSLPRQTQYAQEQNEFLRKALDPELTGMTPDEVKSLTPEPTLGFLSPKNYGTAAGGSIFGDVGSKVLGGVGDVGSVLTAISGHPIAPPRTSITDLAAISKLKTAHSQQAAETGLIGTLSGYKDPKDPTQILPAAQVAIDAVKTGDTASGLRFLQNERNPPWRGRPDEREALVTQQQQTQWRENAKRMVWPANDGGKSRAIYETTGRVDVPGTPTPPAPKPFTLKELDTEAQDYEQKAVEQSRTHSIGGRGRAFDPANVEKYRNARIRQLQKDGYDVIGPDGKPIPKLPDEPAPTTSTTAPTTTSTSSSTSTSTRPPGPSTTSTTVPGARLDDTPIPPPGNPMRTPEKEAQLDEIKKAWRAGAISDDAAKEQMHDLFYPPLRR